jgi:hypothetical protein
MYAKILVPLDTNQKESYWLKEPLETALMISQIPERSIHLMSAIPYHLLE